MADEQILQHILKSIATSPHLNRQPNEALGLWIERAFGGLGMAMRRADEPPIPGEPLMSMADAKALVRRAVKEFGNYGR